MSFLTDLLATAPGALYPADDTAAATMRDASGNARNGSYTGALTLRAAKLNVDPGDYAVDYAGGRGVVPYGGWMNCSDKMTAAALVRFDAFGSNRVIFARDDTGTNILWRLFVLNTGQLIGYVYLSGVGLVGIAGPTLAVNTTYMVALRKNGAANQLLVNGVVVGTTTNAAVMATLGFTGLLTGSLSSGSEALDGRASFATYWPGVALSDAQLLALYQSAMGLAVPATPTGLAADPDLTTVALTWAVASGATGYDVRVNGGTPTAVGNVTGYTVTGLTPATAYTLEVRATNANGPSGWASITTTTDTPVLPPPAPTGLAYDPTPETLALTWAAAPGATGYDVRLDAGPAVAVGNVLSHTFTGLEDYTAHTLEVRATNTGGASAWASLDAATVHYPPVTYTAAVRLELGPESDPVDVTGTTRTITARRGLSADTSGVSSALEPGTLIATVYGAGVSPQDNPHARPGRPIRLYARDGDDWVRVWTGTLDRTRLDFRPRDDYDAPERVVIFEASDAVVDLAALPATTAIGGTFRQRAAHVLDGTGIPYVVTDAGTDDPTPPVLPTDATTVLGQLVLARDTTHAVMHLDASGVLQLYADRDRPSTHAAVLFSDDLADAAPGTAFYTHLEPQFDTADLLNVLEVTTVGEETPATYVDTDSRDEWGPSPAAVTVNEGDPEDHAVRYLAGRTTPTLAVKRVQFNVTARTGDAALVDVNDAVRIRHRDLGDSLAQVLDITHTITATRWTVSLTLRALETLPIRWVDVPAGLTWDDVPAGLTWDDAVTWRP